MGARALLKKYQIYVSPDWLINTEQKIARYCLCRWIFRGQSEKLRAVSNAVEVQTINCVVLRRRVEYLYKGRIDCLCHPLVGQRNQRNDRRQRIGCLWSICDTSLEEERVFVLFPKREF